MAWEESNPWFAGSLLAPQPTENQTWPGGGGPGFWCGRPPLPATNYCWHSAATLSDVKARTLSEIGWNNSVDKKINVVRKDKNCETTGWKSVNSSSENGRRILKKISIVQTTQELLHNLT